MFKVVQVINFKTGYNIVKIDSLSDKLDTLHFDKFLENMNFQEQVQKTSARSDTFSFGQNYFLECLD